jgi:hypothetical protein
MMSLPLRLSKDADPLGLHKMTALRWLERLVVKCGEAFRVQLEGSLCCQLPPGPAVPADGEASQGAADLASGLVRTSTVSHVR